MASEAYDVLIVGGGLVGSSLARALAPLGLRIGIVEATPADAPAQPSFDARTTALSYTSRQIFDVIGAWPAIAAGGMAPIRRIHVSERGRPGLTHIDAAALGVEALGYVADNRVLGAGLQAALAAQAGVEWLCPALPVHLEFGGAQAAVHIEAGGERQVLNARLVVAADGGNSAVRRLTGTPARSAGYGQTAIIANVRTEQPHRDTAYERFTETGPLALLPAWSAEPDVHRCAMVWTARDAQVEELLGLDEDAFLERLQARFGMRLGRLLAVSARHAYPLSLLHMPQQVKPRLVFIGNAAHTLHPVAGQGFNLGLRDVAALAQVLADAWRAGGDPGAPDTLRRYARWRRRDQLQTTLVTDGLVRAFSNDFLPLAVLRNLGLSGLSLVPPLKRAFARGAMGFVGKVPRLARGVPL